MKTFEDSLFICILLLLLFQLPVIMSASFALHISDQINSYQGNNGYLWQQQPTDRSQLLENIFLSSLVFKWQFLSLKAGIGIYSPLQSSEISFDYLPYGQIALNFDRIQIYMGNLESTHNYPSVMLDIVTSFEPRTRLINRKSISINRGFFERGFQLFVAYPKYTGAFFFNFQTHMLKEEKNVFDLGLIQSIYLKYIPFYLAIHHFQSSSFKTNTTENIMNLTLSTGLRKDTFDTLLLFSYYRYQDTNPLITSITGEGLYLDYYYYTDDWIIQPIFWITTQFLWKNHKFISLEGDSFFRTPLYIGLNIYKIFKITEFSQVKIILINGGYLPDTDSEFYWKMIRYDQVVKFEWEYTLPF